MSPHLHRRARSRTMLASSVIVGCSLVAAPAFAAPAIADTTAMPKNVILLISDGAGYNQFDAARLFTSGTSTDQVSVDPATGAIERMESTPSEVYDDYPVRIASSHYPAGGGYVTEDAWGSFTQVQSGSTDSAAAGTALGTGVKTNNGVLGYDPEGNRLLTVGEHASALGKSTGVVTSVPFNHATPAGFIAHNQDRNDYHGLATEMIDSDLDVIMGGGHPNFTDAHTSRSSNYTWISQTDFDRVSSGETDWDFVESRSSFEALATAEQTPDRVFGLAQVGETLQYNRPGVQNRDVTPGTDRWNDVPSLETMALGALNVLDNNDDGFFLMVEGGAIDWAGHANQTTRIVEEQVAFNEMATAVDTWVAENSNWDETLVIVTADHETGYLAGPGANPTWTPMTGEQGALPNVSWHSGGHTNQLVPMYAKGAGSDLLDARATSYDMVRGSYLDNTDIGQTLFDLMGPAYSGGETTVGVEATVPVPDMTGSLSLTVASNGPVVMDLVSERMLSGALPEVTVTDSRGEVQSQGRGWTASGTAADFRAGNRLIAAENLSWTPSVVSSENGAMAGPAATLESAAALAMSDRLTRVGSTVLSADLALSVPDGATAGRYGSEIVLTVFPTD